MDLRADLSLANILEDYHKPEVPNKSERKSQKYDEQPR